MLKEENIETNKVGKINEGDGIHPNICYGDDIQ